MPIYITTQHSLSPGDQQVLKAVFGKDVLNPSASENQDPSTSIVKMHFICNPDGSIRWIYPSNLRRPLFLETYNSPTRKAKWLRRGFRFLFATGGKGLCKSGTLNLLHAGDFESLPFAPSKDQFAIFTGTPGPSRKAVAVLQDEKGQRFVKIAVGSEAGVRLRHELQAQARVTGLDLKRWKVPAGEMSGPGVTVLESLRPARPVSPAKLESLHLEALFEMCRKTAVNDESAHLHFFQQIDRRLNRLDAGRQLSGLGWMVSQLRGLLKMLQSQPKSAFSYAHGDFTPWNMYGGEGHLRVYDWEMAGRKPVLYDLFHFIFQSEVLVQQKGFAEVQSRVESVCAQSNVQTLLGEWGLERDRQMQMYLLETCTSYLLRFQKQSGLHAQAWWSMRCWANAVAVKGECNSTLSCRTTFLRDLGEWLPGRKAAVMRGPKGALEYLGLGSDLDLLVHRSCGKSLLAMLQQHPLVLKHRCFGQSFMEQVEVHFVDGGFLSLDLIYDVRRKAVRLLSADALLKRSHIDSYGVRRLRPEDQLEYALLFYSLNNAPLPAMVFAQFESLPLEQRGNFAAKLARKYGVQISSLKLDPQQPLSAPHLRQTLLLSALNSRLDRLRMRWDYLRDVLRRFSHSQGMAISFSGVDGAGKSTLLTATEELLAQRFRRKVKVLRHRPSLLPILSAFRHGKQGAEARAAQQLPRQGKNRNLLSSMLRFAWYYSDYFVGQWYVWLRYERRGHVVLYDRYYYDMIADPRRSNINVPAWLVRFMGKAIRKPSLNFLLTADAEAILQRKKELSKEDIIGLTDRYTSLFDRLASKTAPTQFITLHNQGIHASVEQVLNAYRKAL